MTRLRVVPANRDQAFAFIAAWHRHHPPPTANVWAVGVAAGDQLVGVATCGRPVARHYQDGLTAEVTRVATDGTPNACSALYGACWRAAKAMGYARALTYTQDGESGASLRAAGWLPLARRAPRSGWDMPGRRRIDRHPTGIGRLLWGVGAWVRDEDGSPRPADDPALPTRTSMPPSVEEPQDLFSLIEVVAS